MFANFEEKNFMRFREFDEARGFIENLDSNSYDAIDYMIYHKEYYFLLKNILKQLNKIIEINYIFLNLPCLSRKDDFEMLEKIFIDGDSQIRHIIIDYLKSCRNTDEIAKLKERFGDNF